ncbi:MAG: hypothetical protein OEM52_14595 [bacterium]|nr:hypothetical protein [bacterium]
MQINQLWNKDSPALYNRLQDHVSFQHLLEGHQRFLSNRRFFPKQAVHDLKLVKERQTPHTAIFTCSDSRVISEVIFDQGIGDLFVVRNAGNILSQQVYGSIEFAVSELRVSLVIVMGHSNCGAATSAQNSERVFPDGSYLPSIVQAYRRPFEIAQSRYKRDVCDQAVKLHVRDVVEEMRNTEVLKRTGNTAKPVEIIGAFFSYRTHRVHLLHW